MCTTSRMALGVKLVRLINDSTNQGSAYEGYEEPFP